jgi:hypothetical protein
VFITGRRQSELDAAVKEIGKNITGVQGNVSNLADLDRLYATVKQQKGRIDAQIADLMSINIAIQLVAWIAIASGIFVLVVMCEPQKS